MFGLFDDFFDFNHDGKMDSIERAAEFQFMDDMYRDEILHDTEDLSPEERREALRNAGYDFDEDDDF